MGKSLQLINLVAALLSLLILFPNLVGFPLSINQQWLLFGILMLTTGLPHGATDHLVYKNSSHGLSQQSFWGLFLGRYFLLMGVYTFLWLIFPSLSLFIFLLLSFFHFGQSEFFYIKAPEKHPVKIILYFSWGALILLSMLHFNFEESLLLIGEIVTFEGEIQHFWTEYGIFILAGLTSITILCLIFFVLKKQLTLYDLLIEISIITLFTFIFFYASLIISFAIYFGLWHAVKAIYFELKAFNQRAKISFKKMIWEALPFTLISVLGIGLLLFISQWISDIVSPLMLFFIVISVLTLPHMTFMAALYQDHMLISHEDNFLD